MRRRKLRYRIAESLGYDLAKKKRNAHAYPDLHVAHVLEASGVNCVIDVGANVGQYGEGLRKAGYAGRIVSFEPVAAIFEELAHKASGDPEWVCHPFALGSQDRVQPMNVMTSSVFSSFLSTTQLAEERFTDQIPIERVEDVQVRRLDSLLHEIVAGLAAPRIFLKMDTQGYDLEVFSGAGSSLDRVVGLQSELSLNPLYEGMPTFLDALGTYQKHGFRVTGFYPVSRDSSRLTLLEVDCVMVRDRIAE